METLGQNLSNPSGLCKCGCGQRTNLAYTTRTSKGWVKGEPYDYICGHATKPQGISIKIDPISGCWNWQHGKTKAGYGVIWFDSKPHYVHIVIWEGVNGKVPDGLELDHLCVNTSCVNPEHLEAVTHAENIRRGKNPIERVNVQQYGNKSCDATSGISGLELETIN